MNKNRTISENELDVNDEIVELTDAVYDGMLNDIVYRNNIDALSNVYNSLNEKELIENDVAPAEPFDEIYERLKLDSEVIHEFIENSKGDRNLKNKYASRLIRCLVIQLVLFNAVFIGVGLGKLKYTENTLNLYVVGGLIEIISLVAIIVKHLFKDNISNTLKNMLEKNRKDK